MRGTVWPAVRRWASRDHTATLGGVCAGLVVMVVFCIVGWTRASRPPTPWPPSVPPVVVVTPSPTPGIPICPQVDAMGVCEPRPAVTAAGVLDGALAQLHETAGGAQ